MFECPAVSSSDGMVKLKFDQLHTWYDEVKGRTRHVCVKVREGEAVSYTHLTLPTILLV